MNKRVLQLFGSYNQGGSERQAAALTRLLHEDGAFEVYAATLSKVGVLRTEVESLGLSPIPEFPLTSFYNLNFLKQVRACRRFLNENKIDLVHSHDFYTNVFAMAVGGKAARVASKRETAGMRTGAQDAIEKIALKRADSIVVNAEAVRATLIERGIPKEKIELVYNGLDASRFVASADRAGLDQRYGVPETGQLVVLVANLRHDVKNIPMLLRAGKRVLESRPDTRFVIAGEGGQRAELEGEAVRQGVAANVHFIGRCDDVPALLAASDVCVLTSLAEGFSNSILEYMAAGKPVVATNVGGAAEAIEDEVTGYLVASDDDASMADRLVELLRDSNLAATMGAAGRKKVTEQFSPEAQLRATISLYERLLAK